MVGAPDSDPAHPGLLRLPAGHLHGKVRHHGSQAVVALHQGCRRRLLHYGGRGVWLTDLAPYVGDIVTSQPAETCGSRYLDDLLKPWL